MDETAKKSGRQIQQPAAVAMPARPLSPGAIAMTNLLEEKARRRYGGNPTTVATSMAVKSLA